MNLQVNNIVFGYDKEKLVLNEVSFDVINSNVIAIVGASGSGKSTLLRLISGIIKNNQENFYSGEIRINGYAPEEYREKGNIGFMFQEPALFPNLSVRDNVHLPLKFLHREDINHVNKLLDKVGLMDFIDYLPSQLSGGMKTRVALARTFISEPSLLLLDEPFSSLDIKWKFCLYRELEKLRQEHSGTIILVTHDIQEALLLSNRILVFGSKGKIIDEVLISKPLPRVFDDYPLRDLQEEYIYVHKAIMEN